MRKRVSLFGMLAPCLLAFVLALAGCEGDTGDTGPRGEPGTSVGSISGTVTMSGGGPLANIQVSANPSVLTGADGTFTLDNVPVGVYTLTINNNNNSGTNPDYNPNFPTTTQSVSVKAGETTAVGSVAIEASNNFLVSGTTAAPGTTATLSFTSADGSAVTSVELTQTSGVTVTPAEGATADVMTVELPAVSVFKDRYFNILATERGEIEPDTGGTGTGENQEEPAHAGVLLDRYMVMGINAYDLEETMDIGFTATVTTANGTYTAPVTVTGKFFEFTTGLENVAIGIPVLLHGKSTPMNGTAYTWTMTKPTGATDSSNLVDADTQNPHFTPDVAGAYVISEGGTEVLTVYAGYWYGVIDPEATAANDGAIVPEGLCTACHNDTIAPDKFTPWKATGHAEIFTQNFTAGTPNHYGPECWECHTVGFSPLSESLGNGGFNQVAGYTAFVDQFFPLSLPNDPESARLFAPKASNWTDMLTEYPGVARLANIQCENCHGPNAGDVTGTQFDAAHQTSATTGNLGPRVSTSADVCGSCHGEPARHGRFQQWQESGHGDFTVAMDEGVNDPDTNNGIGVRASCACHSAQGALVWFQQLERGNPSRTLDDISLADSDLSTTDTANDRVTRDNVQPQTCVVCHDPHAEGNRTGVPNNATVRIDGDTPLLPGGFEAMGVGRGAMCITCHNSRNGGTGTTDADGNEIVALHEDNDPFFGTLTAYAEPHRACQGDVLMGRNAYFVIGVRSRHSLIADTCTNCHMEKTPPPADLSYNLGGTNHTFLASDTICTKCHTDASAAGLQDSVDELLARLKDDMGRKAAALAVAADPTVVAPDYAAGDTADFSVNYRGASLTITYAADGSTATPTVPFNDTLAKAAWNYSLIELDMSGGVHNPTFAFAVLDASIQEVAGIVVPAI